MQIGCVWWPHSFQQSWSQTLALGCTFAHCWQSLSSLSHGLSPCDCRWNSWSTPARID
jgi:hypothetical protein